MISTRVIAFIVGLVVVAGAIQYTDLFSVIDGSDGVNCEYQDVEIQAQTFSSIQEFESYWNENSNTEFSSVENSLEFRVNQNTLEYRQCATTIEAST